MGKKLILGGCPKCKGTLSRTGESRPTRSNKAKVEYSCLACGRTVWIEQELGYSDYRHYN